MNTIATRTAIAALLALLLPLTAVADDVTPDLTLSLKTDPNAEAETSPEDLAAARAAFEGGIARGIAGGAITGGALALIPAMTEYNLSYHGEPDIAFLATSIPVMLTAGIPLLASGIGHHASTRHLAYDQRGAAIRARFSRAMTPVWTVTGSLMGTIALAYTVDLAGEGYTSAPGIFASSVGWSMVAGAGALAIDGDQALASLDAPRGHRDNFLRFGIPMMVNGSVALFGVLPAARTGQVFGREDAQAVYAVGGAGAGMLAAGGIALIAGAVSHMPKPDFLAQRGPAIRVLGATPTFDPVKGHGGFSMVGTFR